jgi:hypothetical protein
LNDGLAALREAGERADQDTKLIAKTMGENAAWAGAGAGLGLVGKILGPAVESQLGSATSWIYMTYKRFRHVIRGHTVWGVARAGKSVFNAGEDIAGLIRAAESVAPVRQAGGRFVRVVDAGRTVGMTVPRGKPHPSTLLLQTKQDN